MKDLQQLLVATRAFAAGQDMTLDHLMLSNIREMCKHESFAIIVTELIVRVAYGKAAQQSSLRADAETALMMCYQAALPKLSAVDKSTVEDVLINSQCFAGTDFVEQLKLKRTEKC